MVVGVERGGGAEGPAVGLGGVWWGHGDDRVWRTSPTRILSPEGSNGMLAMQCTLWMSRCPPVGTASPLGTQPSGYLSKTRPSWALGFAYPTAWILPSWRPPPKNGHSRLPEW